MKQSIKIIVILLAALLLLLGGSLFVGQRLFGPSQQEKLVEVWLEEGFTLAEAERRAAAGEEPPRGEESALPPSLQGPEASDQIPEAIAGKEIREIASGNGPLSEVCRSVACRKGIQEVRSLQGSVYSMVSEIYSEFSENIYVVTSICIVRRGKLQPAEPFFSEIQLRDGQWQTERVYISTAELVEELGPFTDLGKQALDELESGCKGPFRFA